MFKSILQSKNGRQEITSSNGYVTSDSKPSIAKDGHNKQSKGRKRLSAMMNRLHLGSTKSKLAANSHNNGGSLNGDTDAEEEYEVLEEVDEVANKSDTFGDCQSDHSDSEYELAPELILDKQSEKTSTSRKNSTSAQQQASSSSSSSASKKQQQQKQRNSIMSKEGYVLPEEQCDIPTFLHTKNCDQYLIEQTRKLLKERYAKNPDYFYEQDFKRMLTDDWTVSRFLLRRRLDPKRTAKLMEECGRFRRQYKMSEVQRWEFPREFHKAGGLFQYAPDRVGNATLYMRVKMYRRVPEISDVFKAFILCVVEECDVANQGRGTAVIFDLSGCGLQNVDLGFLSWLLSSFRNYCPKGLSYIIVYNLPWILNATCKMAMAWMSASNRRALRFVYGDEIENFVARENLPDYLGGTCKLNYRKIPAGSLPAIEVCERLDMTRQQALKIRELFKEYLGDDDDQEEEEEEEKEEKEDKNNVKVTSQQLKSSEKLDRVDNCINNDNLANNEAQQQARRETQRQQPEEATTNSPNVTVATDLVSRASKFIA